jgi:protease PrsW
MAQPPKFIASLRTFRFSAVVPYREALSRELYSDNTVRLLLFFGLFPLAVSLFVRRADLESATWILGVYYAFIWGLVLKDLIRPLQFSWGNTLKCVLFTTFLGIPLLLFVQQIPPFNLLYAAAINQMGLLPRLVGFIFGVGVLEEVCKALSVYIFLVRGRQIDPLTSAFYGSMSGLGFAIAEAVSYSVRYALGLAAAGLTSESFSSYIILNTVRFVSLPLIHAIWAGIVGYFLGLASINPARQTSIIFIGVAVAAVLHGLYDSFAGSLLGLAVLAFSILLFVAYLRRSKQMISELQQAEAEHQVVED